MKSNKLDTSIFEQVRLTIPGKIVDTSPNGVNLDAYAISLFSDLVHFGVFLAGLQLAFRDWQPRRREIKLTES